MKSDYRVRAERFLRSVFPYIQNVLCDENAVKDVIADYNRHHSRNVEVAYGSARIALITSDYVVKWDYDEECVAEIGGCMKEWEVYRHACDAGMSHLFAESTLIDYCGVTFEIMPRVRAVGPTHHKYDFLYMISAAEETWLRENGILYDLHHRNWGIMRNKPVIVDYAYIEME